QDSSVRLEDVKDGTSNTFLFGERSHLDPEFDRLAFTYSPAWYPLGKTGQWAGVFTTSGGSLAQHLLSTPVPINYRVPAGISAEEFLAPPGGQSTRWCAFGGGPRGGATFAPAGGSVRFLSDQTDWAPWRARSPRAGGEGVSPP